MPVCSFGHCESTPATRKHCLEIPAPFLPIYTLLIRHVDNHKICKKFTVLLVKYFAQFRGWRLHFQSSYLQFDAKKKRKKVFLANSWSGSDINLMECGSCRPRSDV